MLWDVDGTLLNAGGVGGDLYSVVFLQLFGRPLETMAPMAGRTDRAIILETLTLAGVPEPRRHVDPFIAGLAAQAPAVRTSVAARGRALPGAAAALAALASGGCTSRCSPATSARWPRSSSPRWDCAIRWTCASAPTATTTRTGRSWCTWRGGAPPPRTSGPVRPGSGGLARS